MGKIARVYFGFKGRSAQPWEQPAESLGISKVMGRVRADNMVVGTDKNQKSV